VGVIGEGLETGECGRARVGLLRSNPHPLPPSPPPPHPSLPSTLHPLSAESCWQLSHFLPHDACPVQCHAVTTSHTLSRLSSSSFHTLLTQSSMTMSSRPSGASSQIPYTVTMFLCW
jgi:hypothetical protein